MNDNDIRELDGTIANLRRAETGIAGMIRTLAEARERLSQAGPHDRDAAARHLAACTLQVRMDAAVLSHEFAALAEAPRR